MSGERAAAAAGGTPYPMFVNLAGRRCAVIGGGAIATDKVAKLVDHGAVVRLVSPQATSGLTRMIEDGLIAEYRRRTYRPADLEGCFLVIAATNLEQVNRMVWQDAEARNMLCNVVDAPSLCSFTVPSTVRRGDLAIAVSTGGASPVLARHIRRRLEEEYGPEWEALVSLMRDLRDELKARHAGMPERREAVERLLASDVLRLLADGDDAGAMEIARQVLDVGVHA